MTQNGHAWVVERGGNESLTWVLWTHRSPGEGDSICHTKRVISESISLTWGLLEAANLSTHELRCRRCLHLATALIVMKYENFDPVSADPPRGTSNHSFIYRKADRILTPTELKAFYSCVGGYMLNAQPHTCRVLYNGLGGMTHTRTCIITSWPYGLHVSDLCTVRFICCRIRARTLNK